MSLLDNLRKNDKKGLFKTSQKSVTYPTGFTPFDYRNGYIVEVRDDEDKLVTQYPAVGITGGTFLTVIGKTGTAKTTWCVQAAYNIVKKFEENAFVVHYDLEQALSYTRVRNITGASQKDLRNKYIIKQEKNYIEDIFDTIMAISKEKETNKDQYTYDTGLLDEFGDPIKVFVPTVIIIDSIPTLSSKDVSDEMEGSTLANRTAKSIAQFYKRLMPVIKASNITVISVNHINAKIEINPFAKSQSQVMYLGQSESLPGGNAPYSIGSLYSDI